MSESRQVGIPWVFAGVLETQQIPQKRLWVKKVPHEKMIVRAIRQTVEKRGARRDLHPRRERVGALR